MAHFITLFFLSIGLNFGSVSDSQNAQLSSFNRTNMYNVSEIEIKKRSKYNSKLFTDKKNTLIFKDGDDTLPIGHDGWD
ncbi:hypothetical protein [Reichenbachiella sp. MALMAid0571]|uniref:hypothetical protein n=1 Tax=Reichenbachiella sp. MALMAid0571 TaxID=3143939 RepID=UPI0032DF7C5C